MDSETLNEKIHRLNSEFIELEPYSDKYPDLFAKERNLLLGLKPQGIIKRIEHFGSTSIPGICSKPIIDLLAEVNSLNEVKISIVPILENRGYEYLWRPTIALDPPWYAWFIKRNDQGKRTHHIHMIEADFKMWERLYFRDYLCEFPDEAKKYDLLKKEVAKKHPNDREAYTLAKSEYIEETTKKASSYYKDKLPKSSYLY